jgi:hypothetical protein
MKNSVGMIVALAKNIAICKTVVHCTNSSINTVNPLDTKKFLVINTRHLASPLRVAVK